MALNYRFTVDGTALADQPRTFDEFSLSITRNKDITGIFEEFTSEVSFRGDGYKILKDILLDRGFCNDVDCLVEIVESDNTVTTVIDGIIRLRDMSHNRTKKRIDTIVVDKSFVGKIESNKSQKFFVNVGKSRNDIPITVPVQRNIDFFRTSDGSWQPYGQRPCYEVFQVMRFLVLAMTDNQVGFRSDFLTSNSEWLGDDNTDAGDVWTDARPYITTGQNMRLGNDDLPPEVSFAKCHREVNKIGNTSMAIETDVTGNLLVRYENTEFFFEQGITATFDNLNELIESIDITRLYATVKVGSGISELVGTFNNAVQLISFKETEFNIRGDCSIDTELDLVTDWIIDTNIYEEVLDNVDSSHDDEIFLFIADAFSNNGGFGLGEAVRFTFSGGAPYHYNDPLKNTDVLDRWLNGIPNSIVKSISSGNAVFRSAVTVGDLSVDFRNYTTLNPHRINGTHFGVEFSDDSTFPNNDVGNNYNNLTHRFSVPSTGNFSFESELFFRITDSIPVVNDPESQIKLTVEIVHADSVPNPIEFTGTSQTFTLPRANPNITVSIFHQTSFDCTVGDFVYVRLFLEPIIVQTTGTTQILVDSHFACTASDLDGGTLKIFDPKDFRATILDATFTIDLATFETLRASPERRIILNEGSDPNNSVTAWIDQLEYNLETSEIQLTATT